MKRKVAAVLLLAASSWPALVGAVHDAAACSVSGFAVGYRKGLMERVARNRRMPVVNCMIATSYYPLGTWVTVRGRRTGKALDCRVTDVVAQQHIAASRKRGLVAELGYTNMPVICGFRTGEWPARSCPVVVSR
jgi:hypothetical protein